MRRKTVPWRGGDLSVLHRPGPDPIVLLHGLCGGAIHFAEAFSVERLADRGLAAIDLPGFGLSEFTTPEDIEISAQADACRTIFGALGLNDKPHLAVHSASGAVAGLLVHDIQSLVMFEGNLIAQNLEFSDRLIEIPEDSFESEYARIVKTARLMLKMQSRIQDDERRKDCAATYAQCMAGSVRKVALEINTWTRANKTVKALVGNQIPFYYYIGNDTNLADNTIHETGLKVKVRRIADAAHFLMLDNPLETYVALAHDTYPQHSGDIQC
jgi:pimeloyl-ACP methyl ester carboxylesterase